MKSNLFRVWDKKRNKYVTKCFTGGFDEAEIKITLEGKLTWECEYGGGIVDGVLEQWTGLLDKNKKKIYEGDIIKGRTPNHQNLTVDYVTFEDGSFIWASSGYIVNDFSDLEIIGNIHENLELINENN
jgi:uncharacterized phage protein (TIGR01671 family)